MAAPPTVQYLRSEEEPQRSAYLRQFPDPEKYLRFLRLVHQYDAKRTRNGLFESPEWGKRGAWDTFRKMEEYARARRAVGLVTINGEDLLCAGEAFAREEHEWAAFVAFRGES
jgi:hypothetical protein